MIEPSPLSYWSRLARTILTDRIKSGKDLPSLLLLGRQSELPTVLIHRWLSDKARAAMPELQWCSGNMHARSVGSLNTMAHWVFRSYNLCSVISESRKSTLRNKAAASTPANSRAGCRRLCKLDNQRLRDEGLLKPPILCELTRDEHGRTADTQISANNFHSLRKPTRASFLSIFSAKARVRNFCRINHN